MHNRLKDECQWLASLYVVQERLPEFLDGVELIGDGYFGKAYRLLNFPGLVIKLCAKERDAFPVYVRYLQSLWWRYPWAPEIVLSGGCEIDNCFWCVMPEYESIREENFYREDGVKPVVKKEFEGLWGAFKDDLQWVKNPKLDINYMLRKRSYSLSLLSMKVKLTELGKKIESFDEKGVLKIDIHPGNVMWSEQKQSLIFLDPFKSVDVKVKRILKQKQRDS